MAEEANLRVELDGFHYNLISNTSEQRLQEIANLVAAKISAVRAEIPHYSTTRAAMLVALQLAEEMLNLQDEYLALLEEADIGAELPPKPEAGPPPAQPQAAQQTLPLEEKPAPSPERHNNAPPQAKQGGNPQQPQQKQQHQQNHKQKNRR